MKPIRCAGCDQVFKPKQHARGKYCSPKCYNENREPRKEVTVKSRRPLRTAKGHPIAPPSGLVPVARLTLYDKIGPGGHPCNWCGDRVSWDAPRYSPEELMADHVDYNTENDDPDNLVPSCNTCNTHRRGSAFGRIKEGELTMQLGNARVRAAEVTCDFCQRKYLVRLALVAQPQLCSSHCRRHYEP